MSYQTVMVHLRPGEPNAGVLKVAGDLAQRFSARLVGVAGCRPIDLTYSDGFYAGEVLDQDRAEMVKELAATEAEFRDALANRNLVLEWRCGITFSLLPDYIAAEARCADLIVTAASTKRELFDGTRHVDTGDLVMQAGRPVVVVPKGVDRLAPEHAVICWKDTREARRAIVDALPLLKEAARVTVIEIAPAERDQATRGQLNDVVAWLERHDIFAAGLMPAVSHNDSGVLSAVLETQDADLIAAGAYGHSRMREWAFGGVTRDLLLKSDRCTLLSH
jgi:nucleotide-binding universal stress UspA family protein